MGAGGACRRYLCDRAEHANHDYRVPADDGGHRIVFALLDDAGTAIRVEEPTDATQGLKSFAEAFVAVIETLNTAKAA